MILTRSGITLSMEGFLSCVIILLFVSFVIYIKSYKPVKILGKRKGKKIPLLAAYKVAIIL